MKTLALVWRWIRSGVCAWESSAAGITFLRLLLQSTNRATVQEIGHGAKQIRNRVSQFLFNGAFHNTILAQSSMIEVHP